MTENTKSDSNNWFGSWINAAKNKSTEVFEFVKKDLEEFGTAVKNEASNVASSTGAALERTLKLDEPQSTASSMKRSFSSFLGQMNNVLNPSPDDSDTEAILITEDSGTVTLTKLQQTIYELQKNEKTFTQDPEPCLDKKYECWLEIVDDQLTEERLTKHLTSSVTLKNQYLSLVPDKVSHQLFWKRYLFRKALIEDELAHEELMQKREVKDTRIVEESLQWEKEDFATDIDLTEEEQIKLLEQYESERKSKTPPRKSLETIDDTQLITDSEETKTQAINKTPSTSSLDAKSSNSSSDGDWEKVNVASDKQLKDL